jgi:hypothetical protein
MNTTQWLTCVVSKSGNACGIVRGYLGVARIETCGDFSSESPPVSGQTNLPHVFQVAQIGNPNWSLVRGVQMVDSLALGTRR